MAHETGFQHLGDFSAHRHSVEVLPVMKRPRPSPSVQELYPDGVVGRVLHLMQQVGLVYVGRYGVIWCRYLGQDICRLEILGPGTWLGWHWEYLGHETGEASYEVWYKYGIRLSDLGL